MNIYCNIEKIIDWEKNDKLDNEQQTEEATNLIQEIFTPKRSRYQRLGLLALCWSNAAMSPPTLEMTSPLKHLPHLAFKEEQPSSSNSKLLEVTSLPHAVDLADCEHLCTTWLRLFRQTGPGISFCAAGMSSPSELLLELELVESISLDYLQKGWEKEGWEFATSKRKQKGGFPPTTPLSQNIAMQRIH